MGSKKKSDGARVHKTIDFEGNYRLIWFGAVEKVKSPSDTPRIHVYLEPFQKGPKSRQGTNEPARREIRSGLVPIGELVDLYLNAVIANGVIVPPGDESRRLDRWEPAHRLNFAQENVQIISRDHQVNGQWVFPAHRRILPQEPEARGFLLAVRVGDDPYGLLIPCTELARFFFMPSSRLGNVLLDDTYIHPYRTLFMPNGTGMDEASGQMYVRIRKRMLDSDARYLAWIASDPLYLRRAAEICLHAAAADTDSNLKLIRAKPPTDGAMTLVYRYYTFLAQGFRRRIVTQIVSCDLSPEFGDLIYCRENTNTKGQKLADKVAETNWENTGEERSSDPEKTRLNEDKPGEDQEPRSEVVGEWKDRFPGLAAIPARKREKPVQFYKAQGGGSAETADSEGTVVEGTSVHSSLERVLLQLDNDYTPETRRLRAGEYADPTKNSEDRLGRVIALLRAIEQSGLASVRFLAPTELWDRLEQATVFAFPAFSRRDAPDAAQYIGAWYFRDRDEKLLRLFLAAEIYRFSDGAYRYVVDTQQRLGTGHSMLILASLDDCEITEGKLRVVIDDCANTCRLRPSGEWSGIIYRTRQHTDRFLDPSNPEFATADIFHPIGRPQLLRKAWEHASHGISSWG